jgi:hydroxymethylpyrimidine pyrophosphatase-like HAD family hydrolase
MKYQALATDYDGTIALDGQVDDDTVAALRRVREAGLQLVVVTGRELSDLFNTFDQIALFDRVVAENGAVLYEPVTKEIHILADAPPRALIDRLTRENIPLSVGHSIVATVEPYGRVVLAAIEELGLDWHVILNKGSVMALPADVTKGTGLRPALDAIGVTHEATIGIGDAENDLAFLRRCGLAVAVANALPMVKAVADVVTDGARGAGVTELIGRWLASDFDDRPMAAISPKGTEN